MSLSSADPTTPDTQSNRPRGRLGGRLASPDDILSVLREIGVLGTAETARLKPLPINPIRQDFSERARYRIEVGSVTACHVLIGNDLRDLWRRTQAFSSACPEIACAGRAFHRSNGFDILVSEYFEGSDLQSLVTRNQLRPDAAVAQANRVAVELEKTLRPSDAESLLQELDWEFLKIGHCPLFNAVDRAFIHDVILPFVRDGALKRPIFRRWTNGDFIASNIFLGGKAVRLVDYEFAADTHFFSEDAWRWQAFSDPAVTKGQSLRLAKSCADAEWLEVFFRLRQLHLSHATHGAAPSGDAENPEISRILELLTAHYSATRDSQLLRPPVGLFADASPATVPQFLPVANASRRAAKSSLFQRAWNWLHR